MRIPLQNESGAAPLKAIAGLAVAGMVAMLVLWLGSKTAYERRLEDANKASVSLSQSVADNEAELKRLRVQIGELDRLRRENAEIHELRAKSGDLGELRKENAELRQELEFMKQITAEAQKESAQLKVTARQQAVAQQQMIAQQAAVTQTRTCIANLKQMDGAKQQWAIDNRKGGDDTPQPADLFGTTLYIKLQPTCPLGGRYTLNAVKLNPTCSHPEHKL